MKFQFKAIYISEIAILCIFLNYYCFNIIFGHLIPFGTYIFYGIAIIGVLISAYKEPIRFGFDIKCWIGYFLLSVATIPIAMSKKYAIDGLADYLQRLILIILIAYICEKEKSIIYAIRLLSITAAACAISTLLTMNDFRQKLTVSSGASISTNDVGSLMAYGCFAILFAFGVGEKSRLHKTVIKIAFIIAAIVVISVAGSRKSIIAIFILFIAMFLFCARDYFKQMTILRFIGILILCVVAFYFVYTYLLPNYEDTNLFIRTAGRRADATAESDEGRIELYKMAMEYFGDNLFFGLGFNNFSYKVGGYTHSTYVESLACSGLLGLLYLIPYIHILINQIKLSFAKSINSDRKNRTRQKELLAFYIAFLFVGIGIPYIYKDIPCVVLAMFIASQKNSFARLNEKDIGDINESKTNKSVVSSS